MRSSGFSDQSHLNAQARKLVDDDRVQLFNVGKDRILAYVHSTMPCEVTLYVRSTGLQGSCSCGARLMGPCLHMLAAAMAAEKVGLVSRVPAAEKSPWKQTIRDLSSNLAIDDTPQRLKPWPAKREILYVIEEVFSDLTDIVMLLAFREHTRKGPKREFRRLRRQDVVKFQFPQPHHEYVTYLLGASASSRVDPRMRFSGGDEVHLRPDHFSAIAQRLSDTGSLHLVDPDNELRPLRWEPTPWELAYRVAPADKPKHFRAHGVLKRGDTERAIQLDDCIHSAGFIMTEDAVSPLEIAGGPAWVRMFTQQLTIPASEVDEFVEKLLRLPRQPKIELPPEVRWTVQNEVPQPKLKIDALQARGATNGPKGRGSPAPARGRAPEKRSVLLGARLNFQYGKHEVSADAEGSVIDTETRIAIPRDTDRERAAWMLATEIGCRPSASGRRSELFVPSDDVPRVLDRLTREGWSVEAEGQVFRSPGPIEFAVVSGIDWFDLQGAISYGSMSVGLPTLLQAARRGETSVPLPDGSFGVIPQEWIARHAALLDLSRTEGEALRYRRSQVGFIDALLATQAAPKVDEMFLRARDELARFDRITPAPTPPGFGTDLRAYQNDAVGWIDFLRRFGFGGCLADDMGLGKTVVVLASLEARRLAKELAPCLIIMPRSLIFNWMSEAKRFAPGLRVLDHSGPARGDLGERITEADLVLTTYGTLRRDIGELRNHEFDTIVLDEAQAIKNATTATAKAARLLQGRHRLALSGTPIENHLGELWSLFEFLNPGMLGATASFDRIAKGEANGADPSSPQSKAWLARALRPFILRRTKEQVMQDLPPRTEQILSCALESDQQRLYEELRDHYRDILLGKIEEDGLAKARFQVLEALLRLRQAACHPALIDKAHASIACAKFDVVLPRIEELIEEGHRALVFSQFTSFLALLRTELDRRGIQYEYLDGRTRDREERVARFQDSSGPPLFLISLRAGGVGLNLIGADYVFLLDPWWNPAVEAQAIDRTHRIGQTRSVLAYRVIARDTVEEKILQLQEGKRALADAILGQDKSVLQTLTREDLEMLLS